MTDRVATFPGRVQLLPVDGQENTYDMILADTPTVVGTPLNKASLLSDAAAAGLGLVAANNPTPSDAFSAINNFWYGTCATAAGTAAKVVTSTGFSLKTGAVIAVKFTYAATSFTTLNVNGTGAYSVRYGNYAPGGATMQASHVATFVFDGTYWKLQNPIFSQVTGTYTGTGTSYTGTETTTGNNAPQTIDLGFTPQFLIVSGAVNSNNYPLINQFAYLGDPNYFHIRIISGGFKVWGWENVGTSFANINPNPYNYIAFRGADTGVY
jgi:hypothetical protein